MGALVTTRLLPVESRVRSAVLGGIGGGAARSRPMAASSAIADALVADDPKSVADPTARAFRAFADSTGADRHALAAIQRAPRFTSAPDLGSISIPVLILIGDNDTLVGSPDELAGLIAGSRVQLVSGDHLSAVMDPAFPRHIVEFFREVEARAGR
jgi:pimeloyl-ACP methyl ester carboxylesterase